MASFYLPLVSHKANCCDQECTFLGICFTLACFACRVQSIGARKDQEKINLCCKAFLSGYCMTLGLHSLYSKIWHSFNHSRHFISFLGTCSKVYINGITRHVRSHLILFTKLYRNNFRNWSSFERVAFCHVVVLS